jgi:nicotinate-nucleotide adenylyltransferase
VSRVAVFGGSFNPPHVGHVLACALILSVEEVDRVLVVPTYMHPFAKPLAPFEDRATMCELAMAWMPGVEVSRVEAELGGESRTLRTLETLARAHPDWALRLIIGADILAEAPRWFGFDAITKLAPPIVLGRAGVAAIGGAHNSAIGGAHNSAIGGAHDDAAPGVAAGAGPALLPEVSSTQVRAAVARGAWTDIEKLVPRAVLAHVRARGLYGTPD